MKQAEAKCDSLLFVGFLVLCAAVFSTHASPSPSIPVLGWSPVHILRNILFGVRNRDLFEYGSTELPTSLPSGGQGSTTSEREDGRSNLDDEKALVEVEKAAFVIHGALPLVNDGGTEGVEEAVTVVPSSLPTSASQFVAKIDEIEALGVDDPVEMRVDPSPLLPVDLPIYGSVLPLES